MKRLVTSRPVDARLWAAREKIQTYDLGSGGWGRAVHTTYRCSTSAYNCKV